MLDLYSNFHFLKIGSGNFPASPGVQTGDFSTVLLVILVCLFMLSSLALIFYYKKRLSLKSKIVEENKSETLASAVKLVTSFVIFVFLLFTFWFVCINKTLALGKSENPTCSLTDVNVNVADTGIDSVDSAVLTNETLDVTASIYEISLVTEEKSLSDTNWKIIYEGNNIYNDLPGKSVTLDTPIEVQPGTKLTFDFEIIMDSQTAISLVDSSPVQLCISYSDSYQEEVIVEVEASVEDFSKCLDNLDAIPSTLKETLKENISKLALETEETIATLSTKAEIDDAFNNYYEKVLSSVKEGSTRNFDSVSASSKNIVSTSYNLTAAVKQEFYNDIDNAYNHTVANIESKNDLDSINNVILDSNQVFNSIYNEIQSAEASATWTVKFETYGSSSSVVDQHIKYGNLAVDPGSIVKEGYDLLGWYYDSDFSSDTLWDFNVKKVGEDAGDIDTCILTLYAKWDGKQVNLSFKINDHGKQPQDTIVKYGEPYGELPEMSDIRWSFLGWYLDSSFANEVTSETIVRTPSAHNLYAKWEEKQEEIYVDIDFRNYTKEAGKELTIEASDGISIVIEKDCDQWTEGAIHTWNAENRNMYLINNTGKSISKITFESNSKHPPGATSLRWLLKGYNSEGQWDPLSTVDIGGGTPENVFFTIQPTESQWNYDKYVMHNQYSYIMGGMFSIKIWFFEE